MFKSCHLDQEKLMPPTGGISFF